ncbi:hypothetical protein TNCV_757041 [Trichonephila clavipes]|nr:hypothetical protein TNCV_757041 [Trichonephila clavipes]
MRRKDPEKDIGHEGKPLAKGIAKIGREGMLGKKELIEWCMKDGLIASINEYPKCNEIIRTRVLFWMGFNGDDAGMFAVPWSFA